MVPPAKKSNAVSYLTPCGDSGIHYEQARRLYYRPRALRLLDAVHGKPAIQEGAAATRACRGHVLLDAGRAPTARRLRRAVVRQRRPLPAEDRRGDQAPSGGD